MSDRNFWLCYYNQRLTEPSRCRHSIDESTVPLDYLAGCCYQSLYADWIYGANSVDVDCLAGWTSINSIVLLYYPKNSASFHYGCWNSGTNPDFAFGSVDSHSRLPDIRVLENFARSQHPPSLITSRRFAFPVPSLFVKRRNFCKAK